MGVDLASAFCMTFETTSLQRHAQIELPESDQGTLYIVRDGAVMVHLLFPDGRRNVLDFRYEGELFYTAHNGKRAGTTLQAIDATKLMMISQETIAELSLDFPEIVHKLVILAAAQIEESAVHNLILNRLTAEERISSFLLNLAIRTGRQLIDRIEFILPMNRADIADFLGLNAETVSRVLTRLKKSGIIELPRPGEAYVEDLPRLASLTPIASAIAGNEQIGKKVVFS